MDGWMKGMEGNEWMETHGRTWMEWMRMNGYGWMGMDGWKVWMDEIVGRIDMDRQGEMEIDRYG